MQVKRTNTIVNEVVKIFRKNYGFARMKMLKEAGIHTRTIAQACSDGIIEKIKPGLYKLSGYARDEHENFVSIALSYQSAVVCLTSAAEYYGLTTFDSPEITIAVPHFSSRIKISYPPVKIYYFSRKQYQGEILPVKTHSGIFNIYSMEKTIIDLFRYRRKIGDDIFLECLKNYLKKSKNNVNKLIACSQQYGNTGAILPYIKAMVV